MLLVNKNVVLRGWTIVWSSVLITCIITGNILFQNDFQEIGWQLCTRYTARISGLLFATAFVASSVQYFVKGIFGFWITANRKFLGISFGLVHLIHLFFIGALFYQFTPSEELHILTLSGGILAYLFTITMLLTSFDGVRHKINDKTWRTLHTIGGYWIWFFFFMSYLLRVDHDLSYAPLLGIFAMVLLLRSTKYLLVKQNSQ